MRVGGRIQRLFWAHRSVITEAGQQVVGFIFFPPESTFDWAPKSGAYICDLIKMRQELVQDKLGTIIGIFKITML